MIFSWVNSIPSTSFCKDARLQFPCRDLERHQKTKTVGAGKPANSENSLGYGTKLANHEPAWLAMTTVETRAFLPSHSRKDFKHGPCKVSTELLSGPPQTYFVQSLPSMCIFRNSFSQSPRTVDTYQGRDPQWVDSKSKIYFVFKTIRGSCRKWKASSSYVQY